MTKWTMQLLLRQMVHRTPRLQPRSRKVPPKARAAVQATTRKGCQLPRRRAHRRWRKRNQAWRDGHTLEHAHCGQTRALVIHVFQRMQHAVAARATASRGSGRVACTPVSGRSTPRNQAREQQSLSHVQIAPPCSSMILRAGPLLIGKM